MKLNELYNKLNAYAPIELSNIFVKKYDAYDNSGIIVDLDKEVSGVLFSLDLTKTAVEKAVKNGCNVIFTHHPAIYTPIKNVECNTPLYTAIKNEIAVISFHLNLDVASGGIDENFNRAVCGDNNADILMPIKDGLGYGRLTTFAGGVSIDKIIDNVKNNLSTKTFYVYNDKKNVSSVATFCGQGLDFYELDLSKNADLIVSADIPHHIILKGIEMGKSIISLTHYSSEFYGLNAFYESVKDKLNVACKINKEDEYLQ